MANLNIAVQLSGVDAGAGSLLVRTTRSMRDFKKEADGGTNSLLKLNKGLEAMTGISAGLAGAIGVFKQTLDFAEEGQQVRDTEDRFKALNQTVGALADDTMQRLQDATDGGVAKLDLMSNASLLLSTKAATTQDELVQLVENVIKLKKPTDDASAAIENFSLLLANKSIPRLDSYGLSASAVKERYDELKKTVDDDTAFRTAVFEQMQVALKDVGQEGEFSANAFTRMKVALTDMTDEAKTNLAEGLEPWVNFILNDYGRAIDEIAAENRRHGGTVDEIVERYKMYNAELEKAGGFNAAITGTTKELRAARQAELETLINTVRTEEEFVEIMIQLGGYSEIAIRDMFRRARATREATGVQDQLNEQMARYRQLLATTATETVIVNRTNEEFNDKLVATSNLMNDVEAANARNRAEIRMLNDATEPYTDTLSEQIDLLSSLTNTTGGLVSVVQDLHGAQAELAAIPTWDATAVEEAQTRIQTANEEIAASYRNTALEIVQSRMAEVIAEGGAEALDSQLAYIQLQEAMGLISAEDAAKLEDIAIKTANITSATNTLLDTYLTDGRLTQQEIDNIAGAVTLVEDNTDLAADSVARFASRGMDDFEDIARAAGRPIPVIEDIHTGMDELTAQQWMLDFNTSSIRDALNLVNDLSSAIASVKSQTSGLPSVPAPSSPEGDTGFASGGQFIVGGSGGIDSQLVSFFATPGEKVTVETPAQQARAGASVAVHNHFYGPVTPQQVSQAETATRRGASDALATARSRGRR